MWRSTSIFFGRLRCCVLEMAVAHGCSDGWCSSAVSRLRLYALSILRGHRSGVLRVAASPSDAPMPSGALRAARPATPGALIIAGALAIAAASRSQWTRSSGGPLPSTRGGDVPRDPHSSPPPIRIARRLSLRPSCSRRGQLRDSSSARVVPRDLHRASGVPFAQWAWLVALLSIGVAIGANRVALPLQRRLRDVSRTAPLGPRDRSRRGRYRPRLGRREV